MEKRYVLTETQLLMLLESDIECNALDNGGVDNWQWYDESITDYLEEEDCDSVAETAVRRLKEYNEYKNA